MKKKTFKTLASLKNIKIIFLRLNKMKAGNSCYYALLSSRILSNNFKIKINQYYNQLCYMPVKMVSYVKEGTQVNGI